MNTLINAIEPSKSSSFNTSILFDSTNNHINIIPKHPNDIQNAEFLSDDI